MEDIRPPAYSIVDVARRRDRRRRNQRIGSALLALTIAAAAVGTVVRVFGTYHERPAGRSISPGTVDDLHLRWHASLGPSVSTPTVGEGVVGVGSSHERSSELVVYAEACAPPSGECRPLWHADMPAPFTGSAVTNGMIYALTGGQGKPSKLWSFDVRCRRDGGPCAPLWTANLGRGGAHVPVVAGGLVIAGTWAGVEAFPARCRTDGGVCPPAWTGKTAIPTWALTAGDGVVYAGTAREGKFGVRGAPRGGVYAFPTECTTPCHPIWTGDSLGGISDLSLGDGRVFVGSTTGPSLYAFSAGCIARGDRCRPLWTADAGCCQPLVTAGDGMAFVVESGTAVYGFRGDCRIDGGTCHPAWTASVLPMTGQGEPTFRGGVVFVAGGLGEETAWAFPADCRDPCRPVWTGRMGGSVLGLAASETSVAVTGEAGLSVFSLDTHSARRASSDSATAFYVAIVVVVGFAALIRARRRGRDTR
jgi:outer membrane protein assembly factor BamB